jgi:hypothetical protein
VADASGAGEVWHWQGTTGWYEPTARGEAARQAKEADWECGWDDADPYAFQARVEAGLEPEAEG